MQSVILILSIFFFVLRSRRLPQDLESEPDLMHMLTTIQVDRFSVNLSVKVGPKAVFPLHFMLHIGYESFRKGTVRIFVLHGDPWHIFQYIAGIVYNNSSVENTCFCISIHRNYSCTNVQKIPCSFYFPKGVKISFF